MKGKILIYNHLVVYQLPLNWDKSSNSVEYNFIIVDQKLINYFFKRDKMRLKVFSKFLAQGFIGIVWYESNEWISYAWMSIPETFGPPHLPRWIRKLPVYWIFYCRTKEQYRGQGLYKASISLLAHLAREREPNAQVYIDTSPDNIPSRKAIESVGFISAGMIYTLTLRLPKFSLIVWGDWNKEAIHPKMLKGD